MRAPNIWVVLCDRPVSDTIPYKAKSACIKWFFFKEEAQNWITDHQKHIKGTNIPTGDCYHKEEVEAGDHSEFLKRMKKDKT